MLLSPRSPYRCLQNCPSDLHPHIHRDLDIDTHGQTHRHKQEHKHTYMHAHRHPLSGTPAGTAWDYTMPSGTPTALAHPHPIADFLGSIHFLLCTREMAHFHLHLIMAPPWPPGMCVSRGEGSSVHFCGPGLLQVSLLWRENWG